jgi:hypothetical protein
MKSTFNVDVGNMRPTKNVWFRDAKLYDASGTVTFTKAETDNLTMLLTASGNIFRSIPSFLLNEIAVNKTYKVLVKTYNNQKVRDGVAISNTSAHVTNMINWVEEKYNKNIREAKMKDTKQKRQMEKNKVVTFFKSHKNELKRIFDLYNVFIEAKLIIVRKLETIKNIGTFYKNDDGFRVAPAEGFVVSDRLKGNAVKLVDRLTFSHQNFNVAKNWSK